MAFQRPSRLLLVCALLASVAGAQTIVLTPSTTSLASAGGSITFTASISYSAKPATLGLSVGLPSGWSYLSGTSVAGTGEPSIAPAAGSTELLEWAFVTVPASPVTFTFTMAYPAMSNGLQLLSSSLVVRDGSGNAPVLVTGPTVTLPGSFNAVGWNGTTGNWNDASRWNPAIVPNNVDSTHYSVSISAGIATLTTAVVLDDLTFTGGTINGAANLTLTGVGSTWTSGTFGGMGELIVAPGAQLVASGSNAHEFSQRTIRNEGLFVWTDQGALQSGNGGAFINRAGATFLDATSGVVDYLITNSSGGTFAFTNAGTYSKSGASTTRVTVPFTNTGNIYISAGTLRFTNTFMQGAAPAAANLAAVAATDTSGSSSIVHVAAGATLQVDNGLNFTAGLLHGGGRIVGNVTNSGFISPGSVIGTMTVQGNLTLLASSRLLFEISGNVQGASYDFLSVSGAATLGGSLSLSMLPGAENNLSATSSLTLLSATSLTGTFANLPNGTRFVADQGIGSFVINYTGTSVVLSDFVPVPEPSTWALLIAGGAMLAGASLRRRRR